MPLSTFRPVTAVPWLRSSAGFCQTRHLAMSCQSKAWHKQGGSPGDAPLSRQPKRTGWQKGGRSSERAWSPKYAPSR